MTDLAPESGPFRIDPRPAPVVGWIVHTTSRDGLWLPDWDGQLHTVRGDADIALHTARETLGTDRVRLFEVRGCA